MKGYFGDLQQKKKELITMINGIDIQDDEDVSEEVLLNRKELLNEFENSRFFHATINGRRRK